MKIDREYKNYIIAKNGTPQYPYNVYSVYEGKRGELVGYERTLRDCKSSIDNGLYDEQAAKYVEFKNKMKAWKGKYNESKEYN